MSGDGLVVNLDNQSSKQKPEYENSTGKVRNNEYGRASSSSQMSDSEIWNGGQRSDSLVKEKVLGQKDEGFFYPEDSKGRDNAAKKISGRQLTIKNVTPEELAHIKAKKQNAKQLEPDALAEKMNKIQKVVKSLKDPPQTI